VICTADTVCADCGKTGLHVPENDLYHPSPVRNIEGSASGHSFDCDACGRHISNRVHTFIDGKCRTCGWEESTLPVTLPGDASGDGKTDIFDALAILQYAVGWDTDLNPDAGDVNDDGKCDIFDALLILQYSVGWDVELK